MGYETIDCNVAEDVVTITLNRPDVLNAMNVRMRAELHHAIQNRAADARVLVLTGSGRVFCSGQDLGDAQRVSDIDLETTLREEYEPLLRALVECRIPTIAAVNGPAAGAGANLALSADIIVASESAYFLQAFARIGLIPDAGGTYWLPRKVGLSRAMGAALLTEPVPARDAADWGMIWKAVPDDEFDDTINDIARKLACGPTEAYRLIKQAMRESLEQTFDEQIAMEARLQGEAGRTRDFREGVAAFFEKRPPRFQGR